MLPGNHGHGTGGRQSGEFVAPAPGESILGDAGGAPAHQPSNPAVASPFTSSASVAMGTAVGQELWSTGGRYVQSNINRWVSVDSLKYYFSVNSQYVANKLKLLMFPFRHSGWVRLQRMGPGDDLCYQPPRDDINAPDLYIPTMSFITWVLVTSIMLGTSFQFTPEVFSATTSTGLVILVLEVMFLKAGFYVLSDGATPPLLTLSALSGYKFLGVCLSMLASLAMGPYGYYAVMIYTSLAMCVFVRGNLRVMWLGPLRNSSNRKYFIAFAMLMQLLWPFVLATRMQ